jgi:hypothetical protein
VYDTARDLADALAAAPDALEGMLAGPSGASLAVPSSRRSLTQ